MTPCVASNLLRYAMYGCNVESQVELGRQQLLRASVFVSCYCCFRVDCPGDEELLGWQTQTCTFARQLLGAICSHCSFCKRAAAFFAARSK